jgi:hypothetical protein
MFSFKALMYNVRLIFSLFLLSPVSTFAVWKRQNQKHRMSPGTKTLGQFLLSLQSLNIYIYIYMNSHLMHCSRFCRIICSRLIIMNYSSPFPACLRKHSSKHLKEQSRNKKSNIEEMDNIHSVKVFPVPSYPSPKH